MHITDPMLNGRKIVSNIGDRNCLFHAISTALSATGPYRTHDQFPMEDAAEMSRRAEVSDDICSIADPISF